MHLWAADLDRIDAARAKLLLDARERKQADAFLQPLHAHRFRARRSIRRTVLGRYLQMPPAAVSFSEEANGRPRLAGAGAATGLCFSASDSGGLAIVAVARTCAIGVDVELVRAIPDWSEIARTNFHPLEWSAISGLPTDEARRAAFYRCWTRKEAVAKAHGLGLGLPFDRFAVSVEPLRVTRLEAIEPGLLPRSWTVHDFSMEPDLYGAVAGGGPLSELKAWSWRP